MKQFIKQSLKQSLCGTFTLPLLSLIFSCATVPTTHQNQPTKQEITLDSLKKDDEKGKTDDSSANSPIKQEHKGSSRQETKPTTIEEKKKGKKKKEDKQQEENKHENRSPITLEKALAEKKNFVSQNDKIQFCQILNENSQIFSSVMLTSLNTQASTTVKKEIAEPFKAKLNIENPSLIKDINFIVEYPVRTAGSSSFSYESVKADDDGVLSFKPPKSDFAIDGEVKVYLDLLNGDTPSEDVHIINENIADSLKTKLITSFSYKVATDKRKISAAIAILDYDKNGKPILNENIVANKLFVKMMQSGFSRAGLAPFEALAKLEGSAIIQHAKGFFNNAVEYYIFGKSYIKNLEKNANNTWECKIECTLYVWNLKRNQKLLEFNLSRTETAKTADAAIRNARINLGAQEMYNKLLYNL